MDESLADLAADIRASTPSNAAEMLTKDRVAETDKIVRGINQIKQVLLQEVDKAILLNKDKMTQLLQKIQGECDKIDSLMKQKMKLIEMLNPEKVLSQGYAILSGKISPGNVVKITTFKKEIEAEVKNIKERN